MWSPWLDKTWEKNEMEKEGEAYDWVRALQNECDVAQNEKDRVTSESGRD